MYKMSKAELTKRLNDPTYRLVYDEKNEFGFETWHDFDAWCNNEVYHMEIMRFLSKEDLETLLEAKKVLIENCPGNEEKC